MLKTNKTKKVSSKKNTKHLWNLFDEEISNSDTNKKIECIYSKSKKDEESDDLYTMIEVVVMNVIYVRVL